MSGVRVAVVTGSSRGIGRAVALRLAADGYAVVVNHRDSTDAAEAVRAEIAQAGVPCTVIRADVTDADAVKALFAEVRGTYGRLDVLVNSAGRLLQGLFAMTPPAKFMRLVNDNLGSAVLCSYAALPLMIKQRSGVIVNVSSSTAFIAPPGLSAYAASKAATNALTRGLAREVAALGIRVNAIAPTWVDTEMVAEIQADPQLAERIKRIPLRRIARAEEIAAIVSALLRDDMTYLLGQTLMVDGGGSL